MESVAGDQERANSFRSVLSQAVNPESAIVLDLRHCATYCVVMSVLVIMTEAMEVFNPDYLKAQL